MIYMRYVLYLIVFTCFFPVHAGSYDDFFIALDRDNVYALRLILQRGFDPNSVSPKTQPALVQAFQSDSFQVAEVLIAHPETDVNASSTKGETPLMLAALKGQLNLCKQLLAREADVNRPGWTPLHYAASGGHQDIVKLLLDNFAYIDSEAPNGMTPLMMAALYGTGDTVKVLLEAGADINLRNLQNQTALELAPRNHNSDTETPLIDARRH
jgi:ankyrin repeat protein